MHHSLRLAFASALILCLIHPAAALQYTGGNPSEGTSRIEGRIFDADGKSALAGVRILAYHLSSEQVFASEPTNKKGAYTIEDLPFGYFDLAIETPDGLYVGNRVINLAPATKVVVNFTLRPYPSSTAPQARQEYPGSQLPPSGLAQVREKLTGRAFWRSPKGVAVIAGLGAAGLLAIAGGGSDSEIDESPVEPEE